MGTCRRVAIGRCDALQFRARCFVLDVVDESGSLVLLTPLREMAARYYDAETAHRVAELVRRNGLPEDGEIVRVVRSRLRP